MALIELHNRSDDSRVSVNASEIAYIGENFRPGTAISAGTVIYFKRQAGPPDSAWGNRLLVREVYELVKGLWERTL